MFLSVSKPKFLLDENVRIDLYNFLKENLFDVKQATKGISDGEVIKISKSERRILITNDSDFSNSELHPKEKIFSIIILKVPQSSPDILIKSFSLYIDKMTLKELKGRVFELRESGLFLQKPKLNP